MTGSGERRYRAPHLRKGSSPGHGPTGGAPPGHLGGSSSGIERASPPAGPKTVADRTRPPAGLADRDAGRAQPAPGRPPAPRPADPAPAARRSTDPTTPTRHPTTPTRHRRPALPAAAAAVLVVVGLLLAAVVVAPGSTPGADAASWSTPAGAGLPETVLGGAATGATVGAWPTSNPLPTTAQTGTAGSTATAAAGFGAADGKTLSIVPAGNNGMVTLGQLLQFEATGQRPLASQDQLLPYERLPYAPGVAAASGAAAGGLTGASLSQHFFPETFALPASQVAGVERPSRHVPVTISWDLHGVPHIVGATRAAAAFGAGYAQAQTRPFEIDVLRHYGAGDLSPFLGPSCADEQMDQTQLLCSAATTAQEQAEIDPLPAELPTDHLGQQTLDWLRSSWPPSTPTWPAPAPTRTCCRPTTSPSASCPPPGS